MSQDDDFAGHDAPPFFSVNRAESAVEPITLKSAQEGLAAQKRGIDFAVGIDQSQTYSWKVTKIRTDFGPPFLASSLAYDDPRDPPIGRAMVALRLKPRTWGSAAHRRFLRRIAKWNARCWQVAPSDAEFPASATGSS